MIDVAVMLSLSHWIRRLWTFVETKLAKRVVIKTQNSEFDLDEIITLLFETAYNENHRYYGLFVCLRPSRQAWSGHSIWEGYPSPTPTIPVERMLWHDIIIDACSRYTDVPIDYTRALFPLLDLQWTSGWTLVQGIGEIFHKLPEDREDLKRYYRRMELRFSHSENSNS